MAQVYRSCLMQFFTWCCQPEQDLRTDNPVREITTKAPRKRKRKLTAAEFHAIRDQLLVSDKGNKRLSGEMMQCFIDLCYLAAQRSTEIRLLRWSQIVDEHICFEPTKTEDSSGAAVDVSLTSAIRDVLERARKLYRVKSLHVIHTMHGDRYTAAGLRSAWDRACLAAGIENATIKDLRPMALSDAKQLRHTIEQLKDAAAHSEVGTTEGYIKGREVVRSEVILTLPKQAPY